MRPKWILVGVALASVMAAGACSSQSTTSSPPATSAPAATGTTAAGGSGTTTKGTTPDQAIDALPIGTTQKDCLKDKVNADPSLKAIAESTTTPSKAEATKFVNLMLSCMSRADLTAVLSANQKDPSSAESKCQTSKIAQLSEDQIAGFLSQDPATVSELQPDFQQCAALGSSTTTG